jgi:DNA-directed RNA polymerase specialized sigma24 family protein
MSSAGSITDLLGLLKGGNAAAAQRLWESYFRRLVGIARSKLQRIPRRAADEEDVALSAFDSFCRGAAQNRFPQLTDRHDLWQVLVVLTSRKAFRLGRHELRQKRGGGRVPSAQTHCGEQLLAELVAREPTPAFAAQVAEECRRRLDRLGNAELKTIALWKMEGYTTDEIAAKQDCAPRTVERKLQRIRNLWMNDS